MQFFLLRFFSGRRKERKKTSKVEAQASTIADWPVSWKNEPFRCADWMDDWLPLSCFLARRLWLVSCYLHSLLVCCILSLSLSRSAVCPMTVDQRQKRPSVLTPAVEGQGQIFLSEWRRVCVCAQRRMKDDEDERTMIDMLWSVQWIWAEITPSRAMFIWQSLVFNLFKCLMLTYVFVYGFTLTPWQCDYRSFTAGFHCVQFSNDHQSRSNTLNCANWHLREEKYRPPFSFSLSLSLSPLLHLQLIT